LVQIYHLLFVKKQKRLFYLKFLGHRVSPKPLVLLPKQPLLVHLHQVHLVLEEGESNERFFK